MNSISKDDWNFEEIRAVDETRAVQLESAGSPTSLARILAQVLDEAIVSENLQIAVDSRSNEFTERRAIVQFQVSPVLYDWFFNARTGYRAQYWINAVAGRTFNNEIVRLLTEVLTRRLPAMVIVRRIEVVVAESRREKDIGPIEIKREEIVRSIAPAASKIWIGERLYSVSDGTITDVGFAALSDAERSPAKLIVPRWAEAVNPKTGQKSEGLRAPFPSAELSWLDLKGGFLNAVGTSAQIKSQDSRAEQIHERGWT